MCNGCTSAGRLGVAVAEVAREMVIMQWSVGWLFLLACLFRAGILRRCRGTGFRVGRGAGIVGGGADLGVKPGGFLQVAPAEEAEWCRFRVGFWAQLIICFGWE